MEYEASKNIRKTNHISSFSGRAKKIDVTGQEFFKPNVGKDELLSYFGV